MPHTGMGNTQDSELKVAVSGMSASTAFSLRSCKPKRNSQWLQPSHIHRHVSTCSIAIFDSGCPLVRMGQPAGERAASFTALGTI